MYKIILHLLTFKKFCKDFASYDDSSKNDFSIKTLWNCLFSEVHSNWKIEPSKNSISPFTTFVPSISTETRFKYHFSQFTWKHCEIMQFFGSRPFKGCLLFSKIPSKILLLPPNHPTNSWIFNLLQTSPTRRSKSTETRFNSALNKFIALKEWHFSGFCFEVQFSKYLRLKTMQSDKIPRTNELCTAHLWLFSNNSPN